DQRLGPLPPERLDVLEPPGAQPLVVPRADVLEVDVAKDDPADAPPHQLVQHPVQRACVVLRVGVRLDQLQPERLRLGGDQLAAHAVEADAAAHALVDVEEVADLQPLPDGAVECESGVLAAAPAQGVDHRQLPTAFRTAPTSTFWPEPTVTVAGMSRSSAKSIAASVTISSVSVPGSRYRNSASKTRSPSASISSSSSALPSAFVSLARKSASVSCRPLRIGSFTESASARDTTLLPLCSSSVALI